MSEGHRRALVVGASGITGFNTAARLAGNGWEVDGLSRRSVQVPAGVTPVNVDIGDAEATANALGGRDFTHLFFCAWSMRETEAENIRVNGAMLRNVLEALSPAGTLQHAALITGLKYYTGPFEAYAEAPLETPFREQQPRTDYPNFYYEQEDALAEAAARDEFTWSAHRSHTVIGWTPGNLVMNMGVTLAVYATICRELDKPFVFPGSPQQHDGLVDMTDGELLAEQLEWAATSPAAANQAVNSANGDIFRWRRMWSVLAADLGAEVSEYPGEPRLLEEEMAEGYEDVWSRIVEKHDLRPTQLDQLASWWHTDADLGRPAETFTDMTKSRELGFHGFRRTDDSFHTLFESLRAERIIPQL